MYMSTPVREIKVANAYPASGTHVRDVPVRKRAAWRAHRSAPTRARPRAKTDPTHAAVREIPPSADIEPSSLSIREVPPSADTEPSSLSFRKVTVSSHNLAAWLYKIYNGELRMMVCACGGDIGKLEASMPSDAQDFATKLLKQTEAQYWIRLRLRECFLTALFYEENTDDENTDIFAVVSDATGWTLDRLTQTPPKEAPKDAEEFAKQLWWGDYTRDKSANENDEFWNSFRKTCLDTSEWNSNKPIEDVLVLSERRLCIKKVSQFWGCSSEQCLGIGDLNGGDSQSSAIEEDMVLVLEQDQFVFDNEGGFVETLQTTAEAVKAGFLSMFNLM